MKAIVPLRLRRVARRTAGVYLLVAGLWILLSDRAVALLTSDPRLIERVSIGKGWFFVIVTGALLYLGLRKQLMHGEAEVAARQRATDALRDAEERQRLFIEHAPAALAMFDREMRYLAVSRRWRDDYNLGSHDLLGKSHYEVFPEISEQWKAIHRRGLAGEVVRAEEDSFTRADGSVQWLRWEVRPWQASDGAVGGVVIFSEDITERIVAERALRESQARYRLLAENVGDVVWVLDLASMRVVYVSPSVERMRGFTAAEVLAEPVLESLSPESAALVQATLPGRIAAFEAGDPAAVTQTHELKQSRRGGGWVWVETVTTLLRNPRGALQVIGVSRNINERRSAEAELRESEGRFRELAETINEVFWITDPQKRQVFYVSPAYERVWGSTSESLYLSPSTWAEAIHSEDRARLENEAAARPATGEYQETYRIVRPDGQVRWIQDRAFPVRDAIGRVLRLVGVAEDITEKQKFETQFLRAQRLEAVGALAGGVAHDLNNILTPMLMATGMLKSETPDARNLELLTMIERSALRGADIIRQLLTFSRGIEGERIPLQPRHLLKEMVAIARETFPREIAVREDIGTDLWPILANATQVHQVLMNLCVNARDAMPTGGDLMIGARNHHLDHGDPQLEAKSKPGDYVVVTVTDTGQGMAPETIARIFEPFFTTKEVGKGTGLGLSTVMGIVRSHGGQVSVYSELGHGSQFRVYFPASPGVDSAPAVPAVAPKPGHGELILVVDDESTIRDATRRLLEKHGYRVLTAGDGKEALSLVLQHRESVRLVLTDVMMPVMGGAALARALQTLDQAIRIVATSGLDQEDKRQELLTLGVSEVLPKPASMDDLLAAVGRQLGKRK